MATVLKPESGSTGALGFLLADVVRLMRREFREQAAGLKLTPALARLLFHVDRQPGCRQSDLAALLEVTPVTLGRMIDRLEQRGLVRRAPDPDDRRAVRIHLTKTARPLIARMDTIVDRVTERATAHLSPAERTTLVRLLVRLRDTLSSGGA
jgi:DNA-binding MarR family transcriptional regulator